MEHHKFNWAEMKFTALRIGMSESDFWDTDPIEFYEMVEMYCELERMKNG